MDCKKCGPWDPCDEHNFFLADRSENEPCEKGTVGCCVNHPETIKHFNHDNKCETW